MIELLFLIGFAVVLFMTGVSIMGMVLERENLRVCTANGQHKLFLASSRHKACYHYQLPATRHGFAASA